MNLLLKGSGVGWSNVGKSNVFLAPSDDLAAFKLVLLPSNPLTKALAYVQERRAGLRVFLDDPEVAIDTNHIERALRPIPTGRKHWLLCWTEVGAKHVGIVQSLIATCRTQGIDPYTSLVDVLQRVGQHPAARVSELTPRRWKTLFADNPLRSDLHRAGCQSTNSGWLTLTQQQRAAHQGAAYADLGRHDACGLELLDPGASEVGTTAPEPRECGDGPKLDGAGDGQGASRRAPVQRVGGCRPFHGLAS